MEELNEEGVDGKIKRFSLPRLCSYIVWSVPTELDNVYQV